MNFFTKILILALFFGFWGTFYIWMLFFNDIPEENLLLYNKKEKSWNEITLDLHDYFKTGCSGFYIRVNQEMNTKNAKSYLKEIKSAFEKKLIIIEQRKGEFEKQANVKIEKESFDNMTIGYINTPENCYNEKINMRIFFEGSLEHERMPGDIYLSVARK